MTAMIIETEKNKWEVICGLEIHCQIVSNSKMFSGASTEYGTEPNHNVSFIDAGMPGMLPTLNEECVRQAIKTGLGLNAKINKYSEFSRKNYFYADLPQGYQITQFQYPLVGEGSLEVETEDGSRRTIGIERIHIEQDAGKSIHDLDPSMTFVDLNRAGVGLMEIVTKPDFRSPEEAGATEAVASTGGNYMPPIMGAVAFVMAQYLRVPYITIVGHAIIPALLYYMALLLYVHFSGKKRGMVPLKPENLPSSKKSIIEGGHLILSLVCLVVFLIFGYTTTMGAFWGVLVLFFLTFVRKGTRLKPIQMVRAFEKTAKMVLSVGSACAAAGIIIGCMYASGLSLSLSNIIIDIAHNNVLVVLILTAVFSLILGCGMPSVGVYLILVMTIIPALTQMGITPMAAHFFAFYFAVVSNITPPVCVAAFAGAAIAGASPMKTGFKAFVIGSAAYIIPFLFVYHPATLGIGTPGEIVIACIDGVIAIFGLAACIVGFVISRLNIIERLIGLAICLLVTAPHMATNITAYTLLAIMVVVQFVKYKRNQIPKVGEALA